MSWVILWRATCRTLGRIPWWGWVIIVITFPCWMSLLLFSSPIILPISIGAAIVLAIVSKRPKVKKVRITGNVRGRVAVRR